MKLILLDEFEPLDDESEAKVPVLAEIVIQHGHRITLSIFQCPYCGGVNGIDSNILAKDNIVHCIACCREIEVIRPDWVSDALKEQWVQADAYVEKGDKKSDTN